MSDIKNFSRIFPFAKFFGLFPVGSKIGRLQINPKTCIFSTIWSLVLLCFHVICFQSLFICTMGGEQLFNQLPSTITHKVLRFVPGVANVQNYLMFIIWFLSLPKILKCWNYIQAYDKTYPSETNRVNIYKDVQFLTLVVNCFLAYLFKCSALTFTFAKLNEIDEACMETLNTSCPNGYFSSHSQWLAYIFESQELRNHSMALHTFVIQLASIFLILFTCFLSRSITLRVTDISNHIKLAQTIFKGKSLFWKLDGKTLDGNHASIILQNEIHRKLILLSEIFDYLSKASADFILVFVLSAIIFISVLSFYCFIKLDISSLFTEPMALCSIFILILNYFLMLNFFNYGDKLNSEVEKMSKLMMQIYSDTWLSTKCLAASLDFQLGGNGFFFLRRKTFGSIVGAIIAYIIVLTQYKISEGQPCEEIVLDPLG